MTPDPAVTRVLSRFGIAPSTIESIRPVAPHAGNHRVLRVQTHQDDWVLKRYPAQFAMDRLIRAHLLETRLAEAGFPLAPLHRSETGETWVEEGSAQYTLRGWVDGEQVSIAQRAQLLDQHPEIVAHLGRSIGTLHRISSTTTHAAPGQPVHPDQLLKAPRRGVRALRRSRPPRLSRWYTLRLKRDKSHFDRWIIDILPTLSQRADYLAGLSLVGRLGQADVGLIHNDINWENLVFDRKFCLRALLDFDNAAQAPRVFEVGAAAVVLVGTEHRLVEEFLTAYESAAAAHVDRDLVHLAMMVKCVQSIINTMTTYLNGNTDLTLRAPWAYQLHESLLILDDQKARLRLDPA